jgi:MFS family permease
MAPFVLFSPLAGVLADRWNRRTAMITSDFGAGLAVLTAALLYLAGRLQPWMVIPINLWMASFNSLMWPAYSASVTLLVPKSQYGRVNGFIQLGEAIPQIAGPALAGVLYVLIHVGNMALIDFGTYLFSVLLMLFFVRLPVPQRTEAGREAKGTIWKEMRFGWDYILARQGLLALLLFFLAINFLDGVLQPLLTSLILDNWQANVFGYLSTIMGIGMLVGTLVMSAWGGAKRKVYSLLGASILCALFLAAAGLRASIPLLGLCGFGFMFSLPFINASSQAIWQSKVAADVQGRVFSVRRTIAASTQIFAPLLAAPLADYVFRPAMSPGGWLVPRLGAIFGVGASRGEGVLISLLGILLALVTVTAFSFRRIRQVEVDLPDHDAVSAATPTSGAINPQSE